MSRCSVCDHGQRDRIEYLLRPAHEGGAGLSLREVSRATGVSKDALMRHRRNHASPELAEAAREHVAASDADDLSDLRAQLQLMLEVAMSKGDFSRASSLARELRATIDAIDKQQARRELLDIERGPRTREPVTLRVVYDDDERIGDVMARLDQEGGMAALNTGIRRLEAEKDRREHEEGRQLPPPVAEEPEPKNTCGNFPPVSEPEPEPDQVGEQIAPTAEPEEWDREQMRADPPDDDDRTSWRPSEDRGDSDDDDVEIIDTPGEVVSRRVNRKRRDDPEYEDIVVREHWDPRLWKPLR